MENSNQPSGGPSYPRLDVEQVSGLKGPGGEVRLELTPTQKAGIRLAAAVGALITVVIIFIGIDWLRNAPTLPSASDPNLNVCRGAGLSPWP